MQTPALCSIRHLQDALGCDCVPIFPTNISFLTNAFVAECSHFTKSVGKASQKNEGGYRSMLMPVVWGLNVTTYK